MLVDATTGRSALAAVSTVTYVRDVVLLEPDRIRNATDCVHGVEHWQREVAALHIVDSDRSAIDPNSAAGRLTLAVPATRQRPLAVYRRQQLFSLHRTATSHDLNP